MPDRRGLRCWGSALVVSGLLWLSGCAASQTIPVKLVFQPKQDTNNGRPVYVLVRTANENEFVTDSYRKMSSLVYPNSSDPTVLKILLVWPNRAQDVKVEVPKGKAVGVYCIFANPGDQWKTLIPDPAESQYNAVLRGSTISIESTRAPKDKDTDSVP